MTKLDTVPAIGVMFDPLVTHADSESLAKFASIKPGSLVTKLRNRLDGAEKMPMNGISAMFKFLTALMNN